MCLTKVSEFRFASQRILDPLPAGDCKLESIRQYYQLPDEEAHTARGELATLVDLFYSVLAPLANKHGLTTWAEVSAFAEEEWYPSRFQMGKFRGAVFTEARGNPAILAWLKLLAQSSNPQTAQMGNWYLRALEKLPVAVAATGIPSESSTGGIAVYIDPELEKFRTLVAAARTRLAEVETARWKLPTHHYDLR